MTTARPAPPPTGSRQLGVPGGLLLGSLRGELLQTVGGALDPNRLALWLRDPGETR